MHRKQLREHFLKKTLSLFWELLDGFFSLRRFTPYVFRNPVEYASKCWDLAAYLLAVLYTNVTAIAHETTLAHNDASPLSHDWAALDRDTAHS